MKLILAKCLHIVKRGKGQISLIPKAFVKDKRRLGGKGV